MRYNQITGVAASCLSAHLLPQGWGCRSLQYVKPGSLIQLDVICVSNQHSPASLESLQEPRLVTQILGNRASPAYQSLLLHSFWFQQKQKGGHWTLGRKYRSQAGCVWEDQTEEKRVGSGRPLRVDIGGASTFRGNHFSLTCFFPWESTGCGGTRKSMDEVRLWLE